MTDLRQSSDRDRTVAGHGRAADLFNDALERSPAERPAFLDRACGDEAELRVEIESLLAAHDQAEEFLARPAIESDAGVIAKEVARAAVGSEVGRYRLVDVIASGGMGTVYRAVRADDAFDQQVAVKVIRCGMISATTRVRFHQERQALAHLEHPYITRLIDGGTTDDGLPYLVMEHVDGRPIDQYCDEECLSVADRLELFRRVCEAVHFAHQNLIVHRDLKPRNILVTPGGTPKLLDFGIAKLLGEGGGAGDATITLLRAMTPRYASPEQVQGTPVTTASDVYSLGVILYELLTGHRPYRLDNRLAYEHGRVVCEEEPATPSLAVSRSADSGATPGTSGAVTPALISSLRGDSPIRLRRLLRGDLDNIIMMALQKEPIRRYASVEQFSEDIRRHLVGLPVVARKDTLAYRAAKLVKRNKGAVAAGLALLAALTIGTVGTSIGMIQARRSEQTAQLERNAAVQAEALARAVAEFLQRTMTGANPYRTGFDVNVVLEMIQQAETRIERDYAGQPAAEVAVRFAIANTYASLWRWSLAQPHLRKGLAIARKRYGDEHPIVADYLTLLGRALTFPGDDESIPITREALRIRRRLFDEDSPEVAWAKTCVCFALWHGPGDREFEEAERLCSDALTVQRELRDTHGVDLAISLHTLAAMYFRMELPARALPIWHEAIDVYRSLPDYVDRYLAEAVRGCALTAGYLGKPDEEKRLLREYNTLTPDAFLADRGPQMGLWNLVIILHHDSRTAAPRGREVLGEEMRQVAGRALRGLAEALADEFPLHSQQFAEFASAATPVELEPMVAYAAHALDLLSRVSEGQSPTEVEHVTYLSTFLALAGKSENADDPLDRLVARCEKDGDTERAAIYRGLAGGAVTAIYHFHP